MADLTDDQREALADPIAEVITAYVRGEAPDQPMASLYAAVAHLMAEVWDECRDAAVAACADSLQAQMLVEYATPRNPYRGEDS